MHESKKIDLMEWKLLERKSRKYRYFVITLKFICSSLFLHHINRSLTVLSLSPHLFLGFCLFICFFIELLCSLEFLSLYFLLFFFSLPWYVEFIIFSSKHKTKSIGISVKLLSGMPLLKMSHIHIYALTH